MSAPKFTPGPWSVRRSHEGYDVDSPSGAVVDDGGMRPFDAALVCAAPDLYAACEAMARELAEIGERENEPDTEGLTAALYALAKARGES